MKSVIFLGPTLPVEEARMLLDASYVGPAAMGDVYDIVERIHPDVIGIIDGYFDSVPSVWHKEILFAMSKGIRVVGAASLGAIRAAELWTFGMEGHGWIFEAYRSQMLEDDDEVAVVHDGANNHYRPLSTPMVNLRVGLLQAYKRGLITTSTHDLMVELAKRCYYPERSWKRLYHEAVGQGIPTDQINSLRSFVQAERPDIKRDDAFEMLKQISAEPSRQSLKRFLTFSPTIFWDKLTNDERRVGSHSTGVVRAENIRRLVRASKHDLFDLLQESLFIHLVKKEFGHLNLQITQEQFNAAVADFRRQRNLTSAESVRLWLDKSGLTSDQFNELMKIETQVRALLGIYTREIDESLIDALALTERLREAFALLREQDNWSHSDI